MHYQMIRMSERLCCCMDVATGSLLTGIYTGFLSLVFMAIGIDSMVEASRTVHNRSDLMILNAVYGILTALSVLLVVASVSLVLGAAHKSKTYLIIWIILEPLWTIVVFCQLIVLPANYNNAVALSDFTSRVCGTVFVVVVNVFCMFCVCLFLATLVKSPVNQLRKLGVMEALESGFSSGYSRLRESIRPSKSKNAARFSRKAVADPVTLPEVNVSVVLNPNKLEVSRPNSERPPSTPRRDVQTESVHGVGEGWTQPLPVADQLGTTSQPGGFVNVGFSTDD